MKIDQTSSFKREFKRIKNKHYKMDELKKAVETLVSQGKKAKDEVQRPCIERAVERIPRVAYPRRVATHL